MVELKMDDRIFEIVSEFPYGYKIWNIGREHFKFENYIPLCRTYNGFCVDVKTLKAFKVSSEEFALKLMDISMTKGLSDKKLREMILEHDSNEVE